MCEHGRPIKHQFHAQSLRFFIASIPDLQSQTFTHHHYHFMFLFLCGFPQLLEKYLLSQLYDTTTPTKCKRILDLYLKNIMLRV